MTTQAAIGTATTVGCGEQAASPTGVEPRGGWLDPEQQAHWRSFRGGVALLMGVLDHELAAQTGLSSHEYEVLVRLSEAPARTMRMSELAQGVAHSRSRLTHTIRRMEDAGLVVRAQCASDARGVNCIMTDAGWSALVAAAPLHVQSVRDHLVDVLSPAQFAALGDAMEAIWVHLTGSCAVDVDASDEPVAAGGARHDA